MDDDTREVLVKAEKRAADIHPGCKVQLHKAARWQATYPGVQSRCYTFSAPSWGHKRPKYPDMHTALGMALDFLKECCDQDLHFIYIVFVLHGAFPVVTIPIALAQAGGQAAIVEKAERNLLPFVLFSLVYVDNC